MKTLIRLGLAACCSVLFVDLPPSAAAEPEPRPSTTAMRVEGMLTDEKALAEAHDIELSGSLAIVAGKGGSLGVVDVSDPRRLRVVGSMVDPQGLFDAETVLIDGPRIFLGTTDFLTVDLAEPSRPNVVAKISDHPKIDHINGMYRHGPYVLAANKDGWIDAFDVSNPAAPQLFGALDVRESRNVASPHDIDAYGDFAVVADAQGFGRMGKHGKLALFRVADPETHRLLPVADWMFAGAVSSRELVGANRVKVSGDYAFVCGSSRTLGGAFVVVDISDPGRPRQVASLPFSDPRGPNGLAVAGRVAFPAGGQTIEAVDVSDPRRPRKLAVARLPDALPTADDNAHDLVYRDGRLYVTSQSDHRLIVVRIDDAGILRLAATPR